VDFVGVEVRKQAGEDRSSGLYEGIASEPIRVLIYRTRTKPLKPSQTRICSAKAPNEPRHHTYTLLMPYCPLRNSTPPTRHPTGSSPAPTQPNPIPRTQSLNPHHEGHCAYPRSHARHIAALPSASKKRDRGWLHRCSARTLAGRYWPMLRSRICALLVSGEISMPTLMRRRLRRLWV
jgi:hypothetical protein